MRAKKEAGFVWKSLMLLAFMVTLGLGQSLQLVSPKAGEPIPSESNYVIKWGADIGISEISLSYTVKGMSGKSQIASSMAASIDSFVWKVPFTPDSLKEVRVYIAESGVVGGLVDSSPLFTIYQSSPDIYEPNNSLAAAYSFVLGDTLERGILSAHDTDVYTFNVEAGEQLSLKVAGLDYDNFMEVLDFGGNNVTTISSFGSSDSTVIRIGNAGKYYIRISSSSYYSASSAKRYRMISHSLSASGMLNLLAPSTSVSINSEENYIIRWQCDASVKSVVLRLRDGKGKSYNLNGLSWPPNINSPVDSFVWNTLLIADTLKDLRVYVEESRVVGGLVDSSPKFSLVQSRPDVFEPNNTLSSAFSFTLGDTLDRGILNTNDTDAFVFAAESGDKISIRIDKLDGEVLDPNGIVLTTISGTAPRIIRINSSGNYYIRIKTDEFRGTTQPIRYMIYANKIVSVLSVPVLDSPTNGLHNVSVNPTLSWSSVPGATSYRVQVIAGSSGAIIRDSSGIDALNFDIKDLENYKSYQWHVCASNAVGTSEWSITRSFITIALPRIPELTAPGTGNSGVTTTPTLTWRIESGYGDTLSYRIQISTSSSFSTLVEDSSELMTTQYLSKGLQTNTTYYWRVNSSNAGGISAWSETWNFKTISGVGIEEALIPNESYVHGNHPNPCNPTTTIHYGLASTGFSKILLFDLQGRQVRCLMDALQPAGNYKVEWDGKDANGNSAATGYYLCRATVGKCSKLIRILLVK